MNPVLILTRNNLALTTRCIDSVLAQDIPCQPWIVDNGSTDGTPDLASAMGFLLVNWASNHGVSIGWNFGLNFLFQTHDHVLCIGNDTQLAPWAYRTLLSYDYPFVTGVAVEDKAQMPKDAPPTTIPVEPHPDFSCFLIRKLAWQRIGPFDERMKLYASDCDYHVRAHRLGVPMVKACVPFYHERSSTMRLASPADQHAIAEQAHLDRQVFEDTYHTLPGQPGYEALFR